MGRISTLYSSKNDELALLYNLILFLIYFVFFGVNILPKYPSNYFRAYQKCLQMSSRDEHIFLLMIFLASII